ncbi:MAG: RHS repeat-associated core domain-containing protein, partial [Gammaproteobacteria bacterium]
GMWGTYTYAYDGGNNILSRTGGTGALTYNYNALTNRLDSISGAQSRSFSYNAKGEITGDGIRSFTLNASGQITAAAGASYAYDGHGKRIKTTLPGGAVEYALYNAAGALVYTQKVQGAAVTKTDYVLLAGKVIAKADQTGGADTITYLHADLLGSPRKATDSAGGQVWREHYDPWGLRLNGVAEKIGYTGHAFDAETGLTYMQARFYDPLVGRFLSTDPIYFSDNNPFTFNRYAYANNNPYKYTDPFGMDTKEQVSKDTSDTNPGDCSGAQQSAACSAAGTVANDPSLHDGDAPSQGGESGGQPASGAQQSGNSGTGQTADLEEQGLEDAGTGNLQGPPLDQVMRRHRHGVPEHSLPSARRNYGVGREF